MPGHVERLQIDLVKAFLHRRVVCFVSRVREMTRIAGEAAGHFSRRDDAHFSLRIDHIRTDEQLLGLTMDHSICRRAADTLRPDDLLESGCDLVKLVTGAKGQMRPVSDDPQAVRPRHHRPRAALALFVEHGQMRVDATDLARFLRMKQGGGKQEAGGDSAHSSSSAQTQAA